MNRLSFRTVFAAFQRPRLALGIAAVCAALTAVGGCETSKKEQVAPPPAPALLPAASTAAGGTLRVEANDRGFFPSHVQIPPNQPTRLTFRRTSDSTCATSVVFPEFKIERELPMNQDVVVDLPAAASGKEFVFQCGMGMYKSKVVAR